MRGLDWAISTRSPYRNNYVRIELRVTSKDILPIVQINYDESALSDDPDKRKLIFKSGYRYPERAMNASKASVSLMFVATASGTLKCNLGRKVNVEKRPKKKLTVPAGCSVSVADLAVSESGSSKSDIESGTRSDLSPISLKVLEKPDLAH
ncbi:hypothetical protein ILUMI_00592 [Ignelater luminosus]|uniref:Uncharacterized protein n=1 Tax=Ignelater luminosus TaxID=2038154 RepID=A0A8K0DLZ8_IGNLU|nr:hypothetical protein ILUMI_00592 [Ignelater luminosus]